MIMLELEVVMLESAEVLREFSVVMLVLWLYTQPALSHIMMLLIKYNRGFVTDRDSAFASVISTDIKTGEGMHSFTCFFRL